MKKSLRCKCHDVLISFVMFCCVTVAFALQTLAFTPSAPFDMTTEFGEVFYVAMTGNDENDGTDAFPLATVSAAIGKADAAIAGGAQSVMIHIADGSYPENGLVVTNAIVITGNQTDRTAVKIGVTGACIFTVNHADAVLMNLTVKDGKILSKNDLGGNVHLNSGTVANCVLTGGGNTGLIDGKGGNLYISGGLVVNSLLTSPLSGPGIYGGNAYIAGGAVSCCIIEKTPKTSSWLAIGAGAYLTGGIIENCLIRDNIAGKGAVYLDGTSAKAINCTIVNNTPSTYGNQGGVGGVYVNKNGASVANCIIFGNGGTENAEWSNQRGACFFNCVSTVENSSGENWTRLPFESKETYFQDDEFWMPLLSSPMIDGGSDLLYPSTSSQTDIAGNVRVSGNAIDIGCSEYNQNGFSFIATVNSYPSVLKGGTVDFVCSACGSDDTVTFELDFGDGSDNIVTTDVNISHRFDVAGLFRVRVRAKEGSKEYLDWVSLNVCICVAEADIYVSPHGDDANNGTAAAPFLTLARALSSLTNVTSACSTDVDGVTIHVADGPYEENALPAIASRVTVEGNAADRTAVKIGKSGARIFRLADEGAILRNLTVQNGTVTATGISSGGGNVRLEAGVVTNCVLTGASATKQDSCGLNLSISGGIAVECLLTSPLVGSSPFGAGAHISGGVVSRCVIEKAPNKTGAWPAHGAGVYLTGGVIENSLLTGNVGGYGVLEFNGNGKAVNCTIVGNTPTNAGGGVTVETASASLINCAIFGNGSTAKNEWGSKNEARFFNCAFSADAAFAGVNSAIKNLTEADFRNYSAGDFRPKRKGALVNAGDNTLYLASNSSEIDLAGSKRIQGKIIDIGCYEASLGNGFTIFVR